MALTDAEIFGRLEGGGRHLLGSFSGLTDAQRVAIPDILEQRSVLIVARTASGKTEAVLAPLLTLLARQRWQGRPCILYVSPTRALVNDLFGRLARKLSAYVDVGRRTGEYRASNQQLLITTPESLDSMLARGATPDGHLLKDVQAVVLDELHILAESARGTQLQVLLARLDSVARREILRVALSATVPDPRALAARFLGTQAVVHLSRGARPLRIDRCLGEVGIPVRGSGVDPLADRMLRIDDASGGYGPLAKRLLELRGEMTGLKALIFVPSRSRCDRLTAILRGMLDGQVPLEVHSHHASLDKQFREHAEEEFAKSDEAVVVATSTLEVGIDIGDVAQVVLDGPPPSVGSLLQRVGRGNRRSEEVFVLPVVHNDVEAVTLASMLRAAIDGDLDPVPDVAHHSVAIQQLASILRQAHRYPRRQVVATLLSAAFGDRSEFILDELIKEEWIEDTGDGRLRPGRPLAEIIDQPMRLHGNIGGGGQLVPLVDAVTGEAFAWVPQGSMPARILVAGASYEQRNRGDAIELSGGIRGGAGAAVRYASRKAPLGRTALRHLSRGLGLPDRALVLRGDGHYHFGGALFGRILDRVGLASGPLRSERDPRSVSRVEFHEAASRYWKDLESLCGFGPFHRSLPEAVRHEAVVRTVRAHQFDELLDGFEVVRDLDPRQAGILDEA